MKDLTPQPEPDASKDALRAVEKATSAEPVNGEDLLGSEDLRAALREARDRLKEKGR